MLVMSMVGIKMAGWCGVQEEERRKSWALAGFYEDCARSLSGGSSWRLEADERSTSSKETRQRRAGYEKGL
jgi:hypothetical protein